MNSLKIENREIKYKIIHKNIKNIYIEAKDGYLEVRCNIFVSKSYIEDLIIKHKRKFLNKLDNDYYYLFGKKYKKNRIDEKKIYKDKLPDIVMNYVKIYSKKMNLYPSKVAFRFNKTRWGSCSVKNSISFNYYLAKLPYELIEYVVIHELAHIKHKNHSIKFWNEVRKYLPDVDEKRKKLREFEKII